MRASVIVSWVLALGLLGCGGSQHPSMRDGIDAIRRAAQERPSDPIAVARWAEAELLMSGGDAAAAEGAIARAIELDVQSPRLFLLRALERHTHGDPDASLEAYLRAIGLARTSHDPLAPVIAEVALAYAIEFDDAVAGYGAQMEEALGPIFEDPGAIGPSARHAIGSILIELAYRRGDLDRVRAIAAAQGCPSEQRVAGPFGPRALLGFDRSFAPEEPGPLAASYDLGPGRGERETRTLEPRGCALHLGNGPVAGPGATYAESIVRAEAEGDYHLRVESPNAVEIFVDDRSLARADRRREALGRVTYHPVHLRAGEHRVMVKTVSRHPNPVLVLSLVPSGQLLDPEPDAGDGPLARVLRAARFAARADFVRARATLEPAVREDQPTSTVLMLAAIVTLSDPLTGGQVAADEARRILMLAGERDARAWYPRLQLANLEPDELTRIGMLERASAEWPEMIVLPLTLIDSLEERGWEARADQVIAQARSVVPDACRPRRAQLQSALRRGRAGEVGTLADELVRCDARSDARVQHAVRQRRWDDALAEVARIAALEPASARYARLDAELSLVRSRGDQGEVERILGELAEILPRSEQIVRMQADRMLAAGDEQGAIRRIEEALREEPDSMAELRRLVRVLGGDDPLRAYRLDGAQVIRDFEASGRRYDGPKVLVLDYTVVRVFEDGSSLELTHNIIRIQSEEAVDSEGEFSPPEDAQLLTLRTIEADGRRLEPDEIQGKDTISLPSLSVGDYVEFEFLRAQPPPGGFPNGAVGDRFYFQSFEVPFDRSELTVILPEAIDPMVDPRGPAPQTEVEVANGTRVLRWRVRESRPRTLEPGAVHSREYLPSVLWGHRASWDMYVESLRDILADRTVRDPAHEGLVREIVGADGHATPEARARRIFHWVLANIDDAEDPFGQAATMVHARTGNRTRVLHYLLGIAGIEADVAVARSFTQDNTESELADEDTYQFLLVRMQGSSGPVWLWPGARGAAFGYLPIDPLVRGQQALVLNERAERVRVDQPPVESDRIHIEADVRLDGEGGAHIAVVETFTGSHAVAWRAQLENVPAAQLEEAFARMYVAQITSGARMTELAITGREDPEQPLVLAYELDVPAFGRLDRDDQLIPQLYRVALANNFARLPRRTTAQIVAGGARDVTMRIHLPSGAGEPSLPEPRTFSAPHGMEARVSATLRDRVVTIERTLRMQMARIDPEEYEDFARFCRTYDEAENTEIRVGL